MVSNTIKTGFHEDKNRGGRRRQMQTGIQERDPGTRTWNGPDAEEIRQNQINNKSESNYHHKKRYSKIEGEKRREKIENRDLLPIAARDGSIT